MKNRHSASIASFTFLLSACSAPAGEMNDPAEINGAGESASVASATEALSLPHDQVAPMPQNASPSALKWAPEFSFDQGCKAYAAVDAAGNTSGGLQDSGSEGGGCRSDGKGNTYHRELAYPNGVVAHLYALYFPKDNGYPIASLGHRHDLEAVVVWVRNDSELLGVAYSAHGNFDVRVAGRDIPLDQTHPQVTYHRDGVTHAFAATSKAGITPPVVDWFAIPAAARAALQNTDFGNAVVPVKDGRFEAQLGEAHAGIAN